MSDHEELIAQARDVASKLGSFSQDRIRDVVRRLATALESQRPTTPERADLREQIESLRVAMLGTEDGGFIDPDSEIPVGEMFRLASEWFALVTPPTPADRAAILEEVAQWLEQSKTIGGAYPDFEDEYQLAAAVRDLATVQPTEEEEHGDDSQQVAPL